MAQALAQVQAVAPARVQTIKKVVRSRHQGAVQWYLVDSALGGDGSLRNAAMMNSEIRQTNSFHVP
jgi:hypothetical protein